jgi:hypothetical protein
MIIDPQGEKTLIRDEDILKKELEEILKHKWIESEKAGYDLGESAIWDWIQRYAPQFRNYWEAKKKDLD